MGWSPRSCLVLTIPIFTENRYTWASPLGLCPDCAAESSGNLKHMYQTRPYSGDSASVVWGWAYISVVPEGSQRNSNVQPGLKHQAREALLQFPS